MVTNQYVDSNKEFTVYGAQTKHERQTLIQTKFSEGNVNLRKPFVLKDLDRICFQTLSDFVGNGVSFLCC